MEQAEASVQGEARTVEIRESLREWKKQEPHCCQRAGPCFDLGDRRQNA